MVGLADEPHVAEAQVAQATVDELRGGTRGAAAEVALVDEGDGEAATRRLRRDPRADDPATDHEQVEPALRELGRRPLARHEPSVCEDMPASTLRRSAGRSVKIPSTRSATSSRIRAGSFTV